MTDSLAFRIGASKCGRIFDRLQRLLGIIVKLFQRGEQNRLRLANKAIAKFEAETLVVA